MNFDTSSVNQRTKKTRPSHLSISVVLGALLLAGCAQTTTRQTPELSKERRSVEPIVSLGGSFKALPAVSHTQSRVVLYRDAQSALTGATSVFLDERYHASLEAGAWSSLCYKTGPVEMGARQMRVGSSPKDLPDTITALTLTPGQTHYVRVQSNGAKPVLQPVAAAQALQELAGTRQQIHTVSRVAIDCQPETAPAVVAPLPDQTYTLTADTLFAFDRADRAAMTDAGTRAIDQLLSRLSQDFSRIDRVHLIGHADPLGKAERNERLAIERALTVREHIMRSGAVAAPITVEGRGSRDPVVSSCGKPATPQTIACNQPNRRVTVEVIGVRR